MAKRGPLQKLLLVSQIPKRLTAQSCDKPDPSPRYKYILLEKSGNFMDFGLTIWKCKPISFQKLALGGESPLWTYQT